MSDNWLRTVQAMSYITYFAATSLCDYIIVSTIHTAYASLRTNINYETTLISQVAPSHIFFSMLQIDGNSSRQQQPKTTVSSNALNLLAL